MNFPENLKYSEDHEWILVDGDKGTVGITAYAGKELGDVVFIEVMTIDDDLAMQEPFGTIEAVKTVSDLLMPVGGHVDEYNTALDDHPELVNNDPYGEGWIIKITISDPNELGQLMTAEQYREFIGQQSIAITRKECTSMRGCIFFASRNPFNPMKKYPLTILLIWAAIIMIIMAIPGNYIPKANSFWSLFSPDKIVHLFLFGPLGYLLANYSGTKDFPATKTVIFSLTLGIIYAILTEVLQFFVFVGRNGNVYDAIADTVGLIIGLFIFVRKPKGR